ncbi:MAG: peptide ABC transporter substrate-binding protein [Anaerolineae bacterium]|nr:peptide ABC transporter substrate-binding protein [Anaerolineae bacterium]
MDQKRLAARIFILVAILSFVLAACGGGQPTPAAQPAEPEAPVAEESTPAPPPTEAPAPEPAERKVATFIWTQEFDSLNPMYSNMWFVLVTWQLWLPWAWEYDENNDAFPRLLIELPSVENGGISADGTEITLKLRDDVKWSDGEPMTSADFKFTYDMYVNPNNAVASAYPYDQVSSVETPDDYTVVVKFGQPFAPWLYMWRGILPSHILKPVYEAEGTLDNAEWNLKPEVGCGPYVFAEWESGSFARFVVNENYWGPRPKIDEIFFRFVPDDASQIAALVAGDGDLGTFIAYSDVPKLKEAGVTIMTQPSGYNEGWFILINEEKGHPALLDVKARQALAMGVDREAINRDLLLGLTGVPASYWDALPFYNTPPLENYPYDPEAAKKLLDEAGWVDSNGDGVRDKDGVELVLTYGTTIREIRQDTQAVVQQQLAEIGIKVELLSYESDLFFSNYGEGPAASGEVDIMEWADGPTAFPDPDIYYWLCSEIPSDDYPAGGNWQFMCDEELDELFQLQATQVNPDERQQTFAKINQIMHDKVYWLGLWQDPDVWAVGPRLTGVKFSGVTPLFNILEWDMK